MTTYTVLIVDDEAPARLILREFLAQDKRFEVQYECSDGRAALEAIPRFTPDIVLLDIQMPEVDGFDVLSGLQDLPSATIMVTAFHEHAIRAFDFHAVDYVLKPIEKERLQRALDRAVQRVDDRRAGQQNRGMQELVAALRQEPARQGAQPDARIVLKTTNSILFLQPDELLWVEASGNYLKLEVAGRTHLVRESIQSLMGRVDDRVFLRIHRSFVVNKNAVVEVKVLPGGSDYAVALRDGRDLPVGRSLRKQVLERLGFAPDG